jgi:hypothetical protein
MIIRTDILQRSYKNSTQKKICTLEKINGGSLERPKVTYKASSIVIIYSFYCDKLSKQNRTEKRESGRKYRNRNNRIRRRIIIIKKDDEQPNLSQL